MPVFNVLPEGEDRSHALLHRVPCFEEALARLLYVVECQKPGGVVVGPSGTGKSLLLRELARQLEQASLSSATCRSVFLDLGGLPQSDLSWGLAVELGISPSEGQSPALRWRRIEDRLRGNHQAGQATVLIFDHVDQHDDATARELRQCGHVARQSGSTVILSVCPPLPAAFLQSAGIQCELRIELAPLTEEETAAFVTAWLEDVSSPPSSEACAAVHALTGGRFRELQQLLQLATFALQTQNVSHLDVDLVELIAWEVWERPAALPKTIRSSGFSAERALARAQ